jgi:hypothetical protein
MTLRVITCKLKADIFSSNQYFIRKIFSSAKKKFADKITLDVKGGKGYVEITALISFIMILLNKWIDNTVTIVCNLI